MLYDDISDNNYEEESKQKPVTKLKDNQIFTEKVFESIFRETRIQLKYDALKIAKIIKEDIAYESLSTKEKVNKAIDLYGGIGMFSTVGEKTFFELHIIFGNDKVFSSELKKHDRDYKKMAETYGTTIACVKMRNLIRLMNNKEKNNENENEEYELDKLIKIIEKKGK